jgi:hypothetical protein
MAGARGRRDGILFRHVASINLLSVVPVNVYGYAAIAAIAAYSLQTTSGDASDRSVAEFDLRFDCRSAHSAHCL